MDSMSPTIAILFFLNRIAVIDTVTRNIYVDDCLTSADTEEHAISLIQNISNVCKRGGFIMFFARSLSGTDSNTILLLVIHLVILNPPLLHTLDMF
jgi:hypothetical protein